MQQLFRISHQHERTLTHSESGKAVSPMSDKQWNNMLIGGLFVVVCLTAWAHLHGRNPVFLEWLQ